MEIYRGLLIIGNAIIAVILFIVAMIGAFGPDSGISSSAVGFLFLALIWVVVHLIYLLGSE